MKVWSQDVYTKAWIFASYAHKDQNMPGSDLPYITHIGNVAMEVMSAIVQSKGVNDPDLSVQCALLHDVIEDTHITYEQVNTEFSQEVADGVLALTKNPNLPTKFEQMHDSLERIKRQPQEVWMAKLADRISNLQPPPHYWTDEKIQQYRDEAITIYEALEAANEVLASRLLKQIEAYKIFITGKYDRSD